MVNRPVFQHRHYKVIAKVLADAREEESGLTGSAVIRAGVIERLEKRFVETFLKDNPKFDVGRFQRAAMKAPDMHGKDKV